MNESIDSARDRYCFCSRSRGGWSGGASFQYDRHCKSKTRYPRCNVCLVGEREGEGEGDRDNTSNDVRY